jgi:hypothetical protein
VSYWSFKKEKGRPVVRVSSINWFLLAILFLIALTSILLVLWGSGFR